MNRAVDVRAGGHFKRQGHRPVGKTRQVDRRWAQPLGFLMDHADGRHFIDYDAVDQNPETRAGVVVDLSLIHIS